ncbi:peptide/nickel transport system substrate-binding protein [Ruminococcus sp. YE71]|uniref:ABC transporter substrate-binding protein n=1 Tax=unclassified Ruminococcus TaxID=2608920 RepID=UPI0008810C81|nr:MULTISPECIES: ABC transporter substrate-binding protein [unclassified Ruminococcus]SDA21778.1 peptide/nickel transport system substrate-binding protein [Ruminococcus sp. YE78]SFW36865.1 peptide/nickel transport system substrate-binding protein [Ruminococcus sp. YE71]
MKKILSSVTALLLTAGALTGCSSTAASDKTAGGNGGSAESEDTITIAVTDELSVVDPIHGYSDQADAILMQVAEGLFEFDSNNQVQPFLAESYEHPDQTTYIYKIRDDVTFSDGNKLTADDVVFSLERHRDTSNPSELAWMFDNVDTIEKTGDYEVTVKLKAPDSMWQNSLSTSAGLVIEKAYFEEHAEDFGTAQGGIIGSGPYVVSEWEPGEEIVLTANEQYWDKDLSLDFNKLVYKNIPDESVTKLSLESGQVDIAFSLSPDSLKEVENYENVNIDSVDMFLTYFVSFNTTKKPFDDVNVRKAVAYAIDKKSLAEALYNNKFGVYGKSLPFERTIEPDTPEWNAFFDSLDEYSYDPEKAKEYLAKSSVPNGFDATLSYELSSEGESVVLAIQQDLAQIGINITLEGLTHADLLTQRYGGSETRTYELLYTAWGSDYPDPVGAIQPMFVSTNNGAGGSNWFEYNNPEFDKLMQQQSAAEGEERDEIIKKSLTILSDEIPDVPVVSPYRNIAVNKRLDYKFSNMMLYNVHFKDVKKAKN